MVRYPFSPEILDALPEELAELFRDLELKLLEEICSRLRIADQLNEVTVQDIRTLRSHGVDLEDIKKAIRKATSIGEEKLDKLLDDVVARNQRYYTDMVDLAGVTAPDRLVNEADIAAIRRQTWGAYKNITGSMGFLTVQGGRLMVSEPAKAYERALDNALMQIQSGAISYNQAISEQVKTLADRGLCVAFDKDGKPLKNRVAYESDHIDQLDVAVRRAVMTGVNQLNQKYREQSMDYLETDLVETTAHLGARNIDGPNGWENHAAWQGKVYRWAAKPKASNGKYPDFEDTCGYGRVTGIGGANCRHSYWPFIEGVSERTYTDAELEAMKPENRPKIKFEGREYDDYQATQKQRQIERTVRKLKRRKTAFEAAGLKEDAQATNIRLRRLSKEYSEFSKAAGLPEQRERMKVLYYDGAAPEKAEKVLAKQSESGIIETKMPKEIPDVRKASVYRKASIPKDVTEEYLTSSTPGIGNITYEDGYKVKGHQTEIAAAEWLKKTFGGDIRLLKESDIKGQTMPDFLWNQKFWELKGTATINGADKLLQHAIKQIHENPGGVILNMLDDIDMPALEKQLASRIHRSKITGLDIIILTKDKLIKILRYKK